MNKRVFILILTLGLLLSLCIAASADSQLEAVKSAGVLNFGTSPDYIPFVFYDDSGVLTGIDVELMKEVSRRMGVTLKSYDLAFDGLLDAVSIGQVDIVGGALSKTADRAEKVDFTRVYFAGDAEMVVLAGYPAPDNVTLESFRDKKVGVQRGTSFDQWVKTNLVSGGFISTKNVFTYAKAADAMAALDRGDIDMVMMDQDNYEKGYMDSKRYKLLYEDFAKENYAFAVAKGSDLLEVVNGHLNDMIKDGSAQQIANKFFSMDFNEASTSIARPEQVATPVPVPTQVVPQPAQCINAMSFVSDVTITDGHQVKPGEGFTKIWRVYNNGSCTWNPGYSFVYVSGDLMAARNAVIDREVRPGTTYDIAVNMIAPSWEGTFKGNWQMRSPQGQSFGQTLWVKVRVKGGAAPTARPQPTAGPQPTQRPGPIPVPTEDPVKAATINYFQPDYYAGNIGDCPMIYWSADNAYLVSISVDNVNVETTGNLTGAGYYCNWNGAGSHTFELCAESNGGYAYAQFTYQTRAPAAPTEVPYVPVVPTEAPYVPVVIDDPVIYDEPVVEDFSWLDDFTDEDYAALEEVFGIESTEDNE